MKRLVVVLLLALAACESQEPPAPCGPIPQVTVNAGETATVTACFDDPNGDALVYSATSSNQGVATASISGTTITITAIAPGNTSVTVTASDPGGLKGEQSLQVMVPNRAPQPTGTMPPITVPVDQAQTVDASSYFSEPDGETLTYSATSSNTAAATVTVAGGTVAVTALAKGTANVMVTATDPGGLAATQTFEVTVPNRAPVAGDPIPEMEVFVGDAAEVDASEHFSDPDGDALVYSASSSNGNVARVSVSGATVRVEAAAQGSATVTVTATDQEGLTAESSFEVTVPNRAPVAGDPIPEMEVFVGDAESFDASEHFSDPDGDELTYSASSSNRNVARVSVSGATVRVEAAAQGSATVTVTATDPEGLTAESSFEVTVPNRAPVAGDPVLDAEVFVGDAAEVDASEHFSDPDGDALTYSASSSNGNVARVSVSGSVVRVEAAAQGSATVRVTATDPEGLSAESSFEVTVPNRAPVAGDPVPEMEVFVGDAAEVDASGHFSDPDGDELAYSASSSNGNVAEVAVSGATVRVEAAAQGSATVTVTATDQEGLTAESSFEVTVPNRAPVAGDPIPEMEVFVGDAAEVDASEHFSDPDGDELTYSASSSNRNVARVSVSGATVRVEAAAQGSATVTVTATDQEGLTAESSFEVTVPNRAPVAGDPVLDAEVFVGDAAEVDASEHFSDPDGDALVYSASSSNRNVARVSVSGATVRVGAVGQGSATVTVTATDPGGLLVGQSFEVTVPNRGPVVSAPIPDAELHVGDTIEVELSEHFSDPDGDELSYTATSSDGEVATASASGAALSVAGVGRGAASVTVTATDPGGLSVEQSFEVTVPDRRPVVSAPISDAELHVGDTVEVELSEHFSDPDGDELSYTATSSDDEIATATASGAALSVAGVGRGAASVTVTATDPGGLSVEQSFAVTVPDRRPVVSAPISDAELHVGDTVEVALSEHFSDPDGDELSYTATSSDDEVATATASGTALIVAGVGRGAASVTVTATDPGGLSVGQSFAVTVPNRRPVVSAAISDAELHVGDTVEVELSEHFSDPDGDELTYSVESSRPSVATATMSGSTLTVVAVAAGRATMTVTATDPGDLSATQSFRATVSASELFNLEMAFTSGVSSTVRSHVEDARDEWEAVLEDTELDDVTLNRTRSCLGISRFVGTVDDHLIFVHVDSIDGEGGILAYAGYCYERMLDLDALVPVMFHELPSSSRSSLSQCLPLKPRRRRAFRGRAGHRGLR